MENKNIYVLAVRVNNKELIPSLKVNGTSTLFLFDSLEKAKHCFLDFYNVVSDGPLKDPLSFAEIIKRLTKFQPTILKFQSEELESAIIKAKTKDKTVVVEGTVLFDRPMLYFRVRDGFIEKYTALDIFKDLQTTFSVNPDGNFLVNQIRVHDMDDDSKDMGPRDAKDVLRELGLL